MGLCLKIVARPPAAMREAFGASGIAEVRRRGTPCFLQAKACGGSGNPSGAGAAWRSYACWRWHTAPQRKVRFVQVMR